MRKETNSGIDALKARVGLFVAAQAAEICRLAAAMADENRAVFQRRRECAELVASLEADLSKARGRLAAAESTLERSRREGEGLVAEADAVCDMLARQPDMVLPQGDGTVDALYEKVAGAVEWLRRQPMAVVELPEPAPAPAAVMVPEPVVVLEPGVVLEPVVVPEPVVVVTEPEPPPAKRTYAPYTPPAQPKAQETFKAWFVRQTDILRTRQVVDHPLGWGAAQLLATWAVRDITLAGRSKNHKFVPVRQAAEVIAAKLKEYDYPYSDWCMAAGWQKRLDSALERAEAKGLPVACERFTTVSRPEHIKKYAAFSAWYYVPGKEPPAGTFPTE